ncbi:MAG: hypothetical protein ACI8TX_003032 [Hyphomicrobiaceae bacterium]|jgi:hypothetical protein
MSLPISPPTSPVLSRLILAAIIAACFSAPPADATSTGPQAGSTGVPEHGELAAEMICTACHTTAALNPDDKGAIALDGVPTNYEPGQAYDLTFRITHPDPQFLRWGFQLTAIRTDTYHRAGELVVTDPITTQLVDGGPGNRQYMEHSYGGTAIGQSGGTAWSFRWVAPSQSTGPVAFYAVGNAANVDGANTGDHVYSRSPAALALISPASPLPAHDCQ